MAISPQLPARTRYPQGASPFGSDPFLTGEAARAMAWEAWGKQERASRSPTVHKTYNPREFAAKQDEVSKSPMGAQEAVVWIRTDGNVVGLALFDDGSRRPTTFIGKEAQRRYAELAAAEGRNDLQSLLARGIGLALETQLQIYGSANKRMRDRLSESEIRAAAELFADTLNRQLIASSASDIPKEVKDFVSSLLLQYRETFLTHLKPHLENQDFQQRFSLVLANSGLFAAFHVPTLMSLELVDLGNRWPNTIADSLNGFSIDGWGERMVPTTDRPGRNRMVNRWVANVLYGELKSRFPSVIILQIRDASGEASHTF